jgi:hypothetical protein
MTRKELQDRQSKYDAAMTKIGQAAAKKYLDKARPPTRGNLRAGLVFLIFAAAVIVIGTAL